MAALHSGDRNSQRAVVVYTAHDEMDADLVKQLLRSCGIECVVQGRLASAVYPGFIGDLSDRSIAYEIERLILELDDIEWQERSGYNRDATVEAERDGDAATVDRLLHERRLLNEQRRSLDKRRDQTRLLARSPVVTG
jgi:hypothetical protein